MDWRERWEYEAQQEAKAYERRSEEDLLKDIQNGRLGHYYQIWYILGKKGSAEKSGMVLWQFLQQHPGESMMLHRYHCAAALFNILGLSKGDENNELRRQVQWDHAGEEARQEALLRLKSTIESIIGKIRMSK